MIEVEIKLPLYRRNATENDLRRTGFVPGDLVRESDIYFTGGGHDFMKSDEALRIRTIHNLTRQTESSVITYKGPKIDTVSMTRKELETGVEDPEILENILLALGYKKLAPVKKLRQYYHRGHIHACADQVENLGSFLELEILVDKEEDRRSALASIEEILKELGYTMKDTTRYSYLCMLQDREQR